MKLLFWIWPWLHEPYWWIRPRTWTNERQDVYEA